MAEILQKHHFVTHQYMGIGQYADLPPPLPPPPPNKGTNLSTEWAAHSWSLSHKFIK